MAGACHRSPPPSCLLRTALAPSEHLRKALIQLAELQTAESIWRAAQESLAGGQWPAHNSTEWALKSWQLAIEALLEWQPKKGATVDDRLRELAQVCTAQKPHGNDPTRSASAR